MEKKRLDENHLTPGEIEEFRVMLFSKIKEILGDVAIMENGILHKEMSDLSNKSIRIADQESDDYNEEFNLGLMESERMLLIDINDALGRIEDGTYGICLGSNKPIPKARLEAIPWAKYCVEYANMLEKGLATKDFDETDSEDQIDEEQDDNLYSTEK